jgi:hypothetical protein
MQKCQIQKKKYFDPLDQHISGCPRLLAPQGDSHRSKIERNKKLLELNFM